MNATIAQAVCALGYPKPVHHRQRPLDQITPRPAKPGHQSRRRRVSAVQNAEAA